LIDSSANCARNWPRDGRRRRAARGDREEQSLSLSRLAQTLAAQLAQLGKLQAQQLESFAQQLSRLTNSNEQRFESLRLALEARLAAMQSDNALKLEEMRRTVDEKLHATLEQRLGESFKLVSDRLEQVHRGLGEMQTLATGVGDLKRVLTNVKTRGTWGEVQLEALLDQLLTAEQYGKNVATRPTVPIGWSLPYVCPGWRRARTNNGRCGCRSMRSFRSRTISACSMRRSEPIRRRSRRRSRRWKCALRDEARKIRDKYVEPPYTTDFAILYLPTEGLYAEALRRPGLVDSLQRDLRICIAGPTTLAALLNSLQMGFRTLAIERRSSEVWAVLGAVKTEFGKFGEALELTRRKLEQASRSIESAGVRTRQIERKLKGVEALPVIEAQLRLGDLEELAPAEDAPAEEET
jgi:DNA recombination protein RmuC